MRSHSFQLDMNTDILPALVTRLTYDGRVDLLDSHNAFQKT